ncbi:hypothetical protein [Archangium sp.]|nr:hypothetical protein [Archangium sp.]
MNAPSRPPFVVKLFETTGLGEHLPITSGQDQTKAFTLTSASAQ